MSTERERYLIGLSLLLFSSLYPLSLIAGLLVVGSFQHISPIVAICAGYLLACAEYAIYFAYPLSLFFILRTRFSRRVTLLIAINGLCFLFAIFVFMVRQTGGGVER